MERDERKAIDAALARLRGALRHAPAAEREDIVFHARDSLEAAAEKGGFPAVAAAVADMDLAGYATQYPPPEPKWVGRRLAFVLRLLAGVMGLLVLGGVVLWFGVPLAAVAILCLTLIGVWTVVAVVASTGTPLSMWMGIRIAIFLVCGADFEL